MCLISVNRGIVLNTEICRVNIQPIVPFERFGKLSKLIIIVSKVIKLLQCKIIKDRHMMNWWGSIDSMQAAKIYFIKFMQRQSLKH